MTNFVKLEMRLSREGWIPMASLVTARIDPGRGPRGIRFPFVRWPSCLPANDLSHLSEAWAQRQVFLQDKMSQT